MWLATNCGIINTNIRDQFSAGGKVDIKTSKNTYNRVPAAFGRIEKHKDLLVETLLSTPEELLKEHWQQLGVNENRILNWIHLASLAAGNNKDECSFIYSMLRDILNT